MKDKVYKTTITRDMVICQWCIEWKSRSQLTPSDEDGKVWDVCRQCAAEEVCECPYAERVHYPHLVKEHDEQSCMVYDGTPCGGCLSCCIRQYNYYQEAMKDEEPFMGDGNDPYQEDVRY